MGVLADFYVARESRAVAYDSNPDAFTYRASYKNITEVEIVTLWAIISGRECTTDFLDDSFEQFENVLTVDEGERLITKLPASLVSTLASVGSEKIPALAAAWAQTDELKSARSTPADVEPIIRDLAKLARQASEFGSNVYLWNCV